MFLIYIKKRIGEINEFYKILILISIFSYLFSLNINYKYLLFIKHSIQLHNNFNRFKP